MKAPRHPHVAFALIAGMLLTVTGMLAVVIPSGADAAELTALAREGEASPDGNGVYLDFFNFADPCLNDSGDVAFSARLGSSSGGTAGDEILARYDVSGTGIIIAREGSLIPDSTGTYGNLVTIPRQYSMNNGGRLAFSVGLLGTPGGSADNMALYSSEGTGTEISHARKGVVVSGSSVSAFYPPMINDMAPAAVACYVNLGTSTLPGAVGMSTGAGSLVSFSFATWLGRAAPDANGSLSKFFDSEPPALKPNAREVAMWAHLAGTAGGFLDDDGIFRAGVGGSPWAQLARGGGAAIGGGTYQEVYGPVMNIGGRAAFRATLYPTSLGDAICVTGSLSGGRIATKGDRAPDMNGYFSGFYEPSLSAGNVTAFKATFYGTTGGGFDDSGVIRGDGLLRVQVAREDQLVPEGGGRFSDFGNIVAINAAAQVMFSATLRGTPGGSSDNHGLYLWDERDGLRKLLRTGDVIAGRTVTGFIALTSRDFGGLRCLNDAGQAVVRINMSGVGGDGIYRISDTRTSVAETAPVPAAAGRLEITPNPSGGDKVAVSWALPAEDVNARITILDVTGRKVATVADRVSGANGNLEWDVRAEGRRDLAPGLYFMRLETADATIVRRMVRLGR